MRKILIIGSEGFIGSSAVDFYLAKGWSVFGIDIKHVPRVQYNYIQVLPQTKDYGHLFEEIKPDVCLFAAGSASVGMSIHDPLSDLEANFLQVTRVLDMIKSHASSCTFINISSAAVYGNPAFLPVKETDAIKPLSPYGWHKYYSELACIEYSSLHNIKTCSIRPFSIYGPGQKKLLLWDIFDKLRKNNPVLFGTGNETRDFIYISDFLKALDLILTNSEMKGEAINVAGGSEVTIASIADMFIKCLGKDAKIEFNSQVRKGDPLRWQADISLLKSYGFTPEVSLESGLINYTEWLKENT